MKKIYLVSFLMVCSVVLYGQAPITTIDRAQGAGPTATGTIANMTAIGMTRTGVTQIGTGSFTSRTWETGTTRNSAQYIQWSITANASYNITLTELDIRYRRNNNQAPKQVQIFYSLDNFNAGGPNPTGFPVGAVQTYANNDTAQKTLVFPLSNVKSGNAGTITFRLYGWDAANTNGEFIIETNTAWAGSLGIPNPGIRILGTIYKELVYSASTWTPNAPSGSTGSDNAIVVDGTYTPGANIALNSLIVRPAGNVSIPSGITVTCPSNLFESTSTTYSSLILDGTITGTVNYRRHVNSGAVAGVGGNDLIAAPLSSQTFSNFAAANGNIRTNPNVSTQKLFGPFSKATGTYLLWDTATNGSETLDAGVGYRAASTDAGEFLFTGTVNTGTVSRSIANSGPQFAQWNLIGNPYPSYLYVKELTGAGAHPGFINTNLAQLETNYVAIYGYDNNPSDGDVYTIWNLANTTSSTVMTPGQGFFVASKTGGGSVDFTAGMRSIGSTDDFIVGRRADEGNNAFLRLDMTNGTQNFVTDFYFNDVSTLGLDPGYDAGLFGGSTPTFSIFSQLVEDNNGVNMAIQSLPYSSLDAEVIVPVGLRVSNGQQLTISMANSTIPVGVEVYLEDTVASTSTLLNTSDYVFTTTSNLNGIGRFYLRFTNTTLSTPDTSFNGLQIYTTATPRTLFVKGQLFSATTVSLYDIQGRIVVTSILDTASNSNQVDVSHLSAGVYVVKLNTSTQQKTQKVILK